MKTFSRFTAIIFIILGVLIILGGILFAFSGALTQVSKPSILTSAFDLTALFLLARIIGGGAICLQGLFLAAIGEGLWLLAGIFDQTTRTGNVLYAMLKRSGQAKQ